MAVFGVSGKNRELEARFDAPPVSEPKPKSRVEQ